MHSNSATGSLQSSHAQLPNSRCCSRSRAVTAVAAVAAVRCSQLSERLAQPQQQLLPIARLEQQMVQPRALHVLQTQLLPSSSNAHRSRCCCCPPAAAAAAAAGPAAAAATDLNPSIYIDPDFDNPEQFVGPIAVVDVPGKGRGLIATQDLVPGQLLLSTPAIAIYEGPEIGDIPQYDELYEMLTLETQAGFSTWQAQWIRTLVNSVGDDSSSSSSSGGGSSSRDGSSSSEARSSSSVPDLWAPPGSLYSVAAVRSDAFDEASNARHEHYCSAAAYEVEEACAARGNVRFQDLGLTESDMWNALVLNCYGEGFQDLPATLCSGATITSQLGLWGPFSMINHACCPNAVNYTLRDYMVVRATAAVPAGDEITINYLGRSSLRPLSQRQEELEASYGFKCKCKRCQTEFKLAGLPTAAGNTVGKLLDQIHEKIGTAYEPMLSQILQQHGQQQGKTLDSQQELLELAEEMQQDWDDLLSAFSSSSSSSSSDALAAAWTKASAFDHLGLLQESLSAAGQNDDHVIDELVEVCEKVCPGSDLHVFQGLRRVSLTQQRQGLESDVARAAMTSLVNAIRCRYGQQIVGDQELLQQMIAAAGRAADMVSF